MLLSLQKGITTPADWSSVIVLRFLRSLPRTDLLIAHPAGAHCRNTITVAHPDNVCALDASMALGNAHGLSALAGIKQAQFVVAGGCRKELASRAEREALDGVSVASEHDTARARLGAQRSHSFTV
jgi:hypothetical protein